MTSTQEPSVQVAKEVILKYLKFETRLRGATTLGTFLLHMPREWRENRTVLQPYPRKLVETAFSAILDLVAEGKLKLVPCLVSDGTTVSIMGDGSSESESHGHWEFGIAPMQSQESTNKLEPSKADRYLQYLNEGFGVHSFGEVREND